MGEAKRRGLHRTMNRPLPSLDAHLGSDRGEAFIDWAEQMFVADYASLKAGTELERIFVRLMRTQMVAAVESLRTEQAAGGDVIKLIGMLPRVMGTCCMYAIASALKDDAPLREFATMLVEEFRFGAKEAADQIAESIEREASHG